MQGIEELRNRLLRRLPLPVTRTILTDAEVIHYDLREKIILPEVALEFVDFPEIGVISLLQPIADGHTTEIATIGNEGMTGIPLALGVSAIPALAFCQVPGRGYRLAKKDFQRHLSNFPEFKKVCDRYVVTLFDQVARTVACNRNHSTTQRCARWLLMTQDRCFSNEFPMTQDFLSSMLGCSRTLVNASAGALLQAGTITYVRGKIKVINRAGLEQLSCGCYAAMRDFSDRVLNDSFSAV